MQHARAFNLVALGILLPTLLGLVVASLTLGLQYPETDLARLGGYGENDFGWTEPQYRYVPHHARADLTIDRSYDVIVVGDSFSHVREYWLWQNDLYRATGLSSLTLPHELLFSDKLARLIRSDSFRKHPPRLLIVETAEWQLLHFFHTYPPLVMPPEVQAHPAPLVARRQAIQPAAFRRDEGANRHGLDLTQTKNYLVKHASRRLLGWDTSIALSLPLTRADLFSNRRSETLLTYSPGLQKAHWKRDELRLVAHNLEALQRLAEGNGRTRFVVMPAPDKDTVYASFLRNPADALPDEVAALAEVADGLHLVRLDTYLVARAKAGVKDIYQPGDTHWSGVGNRLAAERLLSYLKDRGWLVEATPPPGGGG